MYQAGHPEPTRTDASGMRAYFMRLARFFGRPKYDDFHTAVAGSRHSHQIAYAIAHGAARFRVTAFLVSLALYLLLPGFRIFPEADVVFSGDSQNNRRALKEVEALLVDRNDLRLASATQRAGLAYRLRQLSLKHIWQASALVPQSRGKGQFLSLQLLIGSAAFAFHEIQLVARPCRLIALANDHSPISTAVMFAARRHGISTVYRQHAPVTPEFPPLHVDLALLYDEISCEAYREAARAQCTGAMGDAAMTILSPFTGSGYPVESEGPVRTIGICLSLAWNPGPIEALIGDLMKSGDVGAIILRAHPANQQDVSRLLRQPGVTLGVRDAAIEEFARTIDLAFVPNSGVCLELLHLGVPALYRAGMDALGHDLYGFVEAGIIPDWTHRDVAMIEKARSFFDAAWRARFARFDATRSRTPESMRIEAARALEAVLEGRS